MDEAKEKVGARRTTRSPNTRLGRRASAGRLPIRTTVRHSRSQPWPPLRGTPEWDRLKMGEPVRNWARDYNRGFDLCGALANEADAPSRIMAAHRFAVLAYHKRAKAVANAQVALFNSAVVMSDFGTRTLSARAIHYLDVVRSMTTRSGSRAPAPVRSLESSVRAHLGDLDRGGDVEWVDLSGRSFVLEPVGVIARNLVGRVTEYPISGLWGGVLNLIGHEYGIQVRDAEWVAPDCLVAFQREGETLRVTMVADAI